MGNKPRNKTYRTGWKTKVRDKVSKYAARGFIYEVRLMHCSAWTRDGIGARQRYGSLVADLKAATGRVHVAGIPLRNANPMSTRSLIRNRINARIYLTCENDLFLLRLLAKEDFVFRVYRLVEGSGAFDGPDVF